MKSKPFILAVAGLLLFQMALAQQCDYVPPISTDPRGPVNTHSPLKKNFFYWFNAVYPLNWIHNQIAAQIDGPFFQINNPITNNLLDSKDMMPEDGWELVTKGNGYNDDGTPTTTPVTNPYVVLYNKYTGTLRVFFVIGDRLQNYNSLRVEVSFFSSNQNSLLDLGEGEVKALDEAFIRDTKINAVHEYVNDKFNWFYADYPMNYDPCTCMYESKLQIVPYLNTTYKLEMEGQTTGTIVDLASTQKTVDKDLSFSDKINFAANAQQKATEFFKTTGKAIASVTKAVINDNNIPDSKKTAIVDGITNFMDASKAPDWLKGGLQALPWAKEAVSLFSFFIGGGKAGSGAQQVKIQPMAINMTSKFKGTMTNTHTFQPIIIKTPGSKIPANTTAEYPNYNKPMGLFNLLRQPNFALFSTMDAGYQYIWRMFKLNQQLQMVLNFDANVNISEILVAFTCERFKRTNPSSYPTSAVISDPNLGYFNRTVGESFTILDGKTNNGKEVWRTEYYRWCDVMNMHWWFFDGWRDGGGIDLHQHGNISIKFMIRMSRQNCPPGMTCQDILLVKKYKLNLVAGEITVSFDPNDHCSNGVPYLVDYSDEELFCKSTAYKTGRIVAGRLAANNVKEEVAELIEPANTVLKDGVFPNPAGDHINLVIAGVNRQQYQCILSDATGRRFSTFQYSTGQGAQRIPIGHLPDGIYFIKAQVVTKPAESKVFKFVKSGK